MSQRDDVLEYMTANGSLTDKEAWTKLGVGRLGARIYELRQLGHKIVTDRVKVMNRKGANCYIGAYRLVKEEDGEKTGSD